MAQRWTMRRWTLRRQLIAAISLLLVILSVIIGLVSVLALRGYLTDRLDEQLAAATSRFQGVVDRPDGPYNGEHPYSPCLLYTSPSPRDRQKSRMPSSA